MICSGVVACDGIGDDGADVNMAVSTLIARFNFRVTPNTDWLKGAPVKVGDVVDVHDAAELEKRCLEWERHCDSGNDAAEDAFQ